MLGKFIAPNFSELRSRFKLFDETFFVGRSTVYDNRVYGFYHRKEGEPRCTHQCYAARVYHVLIGL